MATPANELRLDDGFSTTIMLQNAPTIKLYEKEVTPPPITAGGPIDTTTMRNLAWRTGAPKKLKGLGQIAATCAYATSAIPVLKAQIGVLQQITINYPDASTLVLWGWLDAFTPGAVKEGDQPTANVVFQPSLRDTDGVETEPVYTPPVESSGAVS